MHVQAAAALLLFALASQAYAKACDLVIEADDQMKYNVEELKLVAACTQVKLTPKSAGKLAANAMSHNWVPTRTADFDPMTKAVMAVDLANSFVNAGDARAIAHEKATGGVETTSVTFFVARLKRDEDSCSSVPPWALGNDEKQAGRGMNH